ncbi:MAG TPA: hypothetical protein VFK72_09565, partial [Nevskia sp.]|nr:hypothetical protein [Nevskia sp.]
KPSLPMSRRPIDAGARTRLDTAARELTCWAMRWTRRWFRQEAAAWREHRAALRERWRVAVRTPDPAEMLRLQMDLLPATTARLAQDHARRVRRFRRLRMRLAEFRLP